MDEFQQSEGQSSSAPANGHDGRGCGWAGRLAAEFGLQEDGSFVLPLIEPVTLGERTIDSLRFRPPRGKDYRTVPADVKELGAVMAFGERLTGELPQVIDRLGARDTTRFLEVAGGFFAGTPEVIGTGPSAPSLGTSAGA